MCLLISPSFDWLLPLLSILPIFLTQNDFGVMLVGGLLSGEKDRIWQSSIACLWFVSCYVFHIQLIDHKKNCKSCTFRGTNPRATPKRCILVSQDTFKHTFKDTPVTSQSS